MRRCVFTFLALLMSLPLAAAPHEARIPLPGMDARKIEGTRFVEALNRALGDGCRVSLQDRSLILHVDREKLPKDGDAIKAAIRVFTAYAAPENTAAQQRHYGLLLPQTIDANKPLVILIHGLDCNRWVWQGIEPLLKEEGYQSATFSYPASQGIADSAKLLAENVVALRESYPMLKLDIVTHSMGSLVARSYIEGSTYSGGIGHLIMLTPPNHGSTWAKAEILSKGIEHYELWRHDPEWRWTWIITDGLGEAARDLEPRSKFLKQLNDGPRREGVKYTIIAGDQNPVFSLAASVVGSPATWVPKRISNWWGFRQTRHGLENAATSLRDHHSDGDGPVSLNSAKLTGVDDFVILHAEHADLLGGSLRPAWNILRDRLSR